MAARQIAAILALPFNAIVVIPVLLLVAAPGLVRRFGDDYRRYKENVPRWLPRLSPWSASG